MFKENKVSGQQSIMDSLNWMAPNNRKRLEESWAPVFFEHVFSRIDETPFSRLYSSSGTGNPNFPVNILLSLEFIKYMKDSTDLEMLDDFYFDYQVNYALGIRVMGEKSLSDRTLYNFRSRIVEYLLNNPDEENILFSQFIQLLRHFAEKANISTFKLRIDTSMFMSNIKKAGRLSLSYDMLMTIIQAIPEGSRTEELNQALGKDFKNDMIYRVKSGDIESRLESLLELCRTGLGVLCSVPNADQKQIAMTQRFLTDQAVIDGDTGQLKAKNRKEILPDSLQSPHDPDATYRIKGNKSQSGYVVAITETCEKSNPFQLITDVAVEKNITSDVQILRDRLPVIKENTDCSDIYADGGFNSDKVDEMAEANNVKIHLTDMTGHKPTVKIPVTEFSIDPQTRCILKCPQGNIPTRAGVGNSQSIAHFPHETCENCPLKNQCYSKRIRKDSVVRINLKAIASSIKREELRRARKENVSLRAAVEGTMSCLLRGGLAKTFVRGLVKNRIVAIYMTAGQNFKRFNRYLHGGYEKQMLARGCGIPVPI